MTPTLKRLLRFLPLSFLASCGGSSTSPPPTPHAAQARLRDSAEPSVLFVGNSFSREVPREFAAITTGKGKPIRVDGATQDGWTLSRHAQHEETLNAIRKGGWDVVILQEQSRLPSNPALLRRAQMTPALSSLVDEIRAAGAIPMLMQTWGYRAGDPDHPDDDFHAMTHRLREGTHAEAARARVPVIGVGDLWEEKIKQGRASELFQDDGRHPTREGNRTTALACYKTLFPDESLE